MVKSYVHYLTDIVGPDDHSSGHISSNSVKSDNNVNISNTDHFGRSRDRSSVCNSVCTSDCKSDLKSHINSVPSSEPSSASTRKLVSDVTLTDIAMFTRPFKPLKQPEVVLNIEDLPFESPVVTVVEVHQYF